MTRLRIQNFAHIRDASIEFGDLTILVGEQGTGKSLALQWLKAAFDGKQIAEALRAAGQEPTSPQTLIDLIFGVGMGSAWRPATSVTLDHMVIAPQSLYRRGNGTERVFFIPAHRAMLISDGWATPFGKLTAETPAVARLFSQYLYERFDALKGDRLFPVDRVLKTEYRRLIDEAVYHGGSVGLEQDRGLAKRLKLQHGDARLPFMTWTAGQREFTPLMFGLYHLLPPRKKVRAEHVDWVVIEEPEMGLHPRAITVFMLLVLELLWRGYRVVLSTHSPLVLTAAWALSRLSQADAPWQLVCDAFGVRPESRTSMKLVAETALTKEVRTYLMSFDDDRTIRSKDISSLDPGADDDDVSGWGGLAGFSSQFGDAVRRAVNAADS